MANTNTAWMPFDKLKNFVPSEDKTVVVLRMNQKTGKKSLGEINDFITDFQKLVIKNEVAQFLEYYEHNLDVDFYQSKAKHSITLIFSLLTPSSSISTVVKAMMKATRYHEKEFSLPSLRDLNLEKPEIISSTAVILKKEALIKHIEKVNLNQQNSDNQSEVEIIEQEKPLSESDIGINGDKSSVNVHTPTSNDIIDYDFNENSLPKWGFCKLEQGSPTITIPWEQLNHEIQVLLRQKVQQHHHQKALDELASELDDPIKRSQFIRKNLTELINLNKRMNNN